MLQRGGKKDNDTLPSKIFCIQIIDIILVEGEFIQNSLHLIMDRFC